MVEKTSFGRQVLLLRESVSPQRAYYGPYSPPDSGGEIDQGEYCSCVQDLQQQEKAYASYRMGGIPRSVKGKRGLSLEDCSVRQKIIRGFFSPFFYFISRALKKTRITQTVFFEKRLQLHYPYSRSKIIIQLTPVHIRTLNRHKSPPFRILINYNNDKCRFFKVLYGSIN
jgi:hypothetical protein